MSPSSATQATAGFARFADAWHGAPASSCTNPLFDAASADDPVFAGVPFEVSAYAYDCVVALAAAASRAGGRTNGSAVATQLPSVEFDGARHRLRHSNRSRSPPVVRSEPSCTSIVELRHLKSHAAMHSGAASFDANGDRTESSISFVLEGYELSGGELHAYRAATLFSGTFNRSAHIRGLGGSELPPDTFDANVVSAIPSAIKRAAVLLTLFCMAAGVVFFAWSVREHHASGPSRRHVIRDLCSIAFSSPRFGRL